MKLWSCENTRGAVLLYALSLAASLLLLAWVLRLWEADLHVPFAYSGDALFTSSSIKGMVENGWYLSNPNIGLPDGSTLYDYPGSDLLHWSIIKAVSVFARHYAVTLNLFFLLTFPLTTLSALFVTRQLGLSPLAAFSVGLLFTFLPYHFLRGEPHLFLSGYYMIPWSVLIVLWVARGEPLLLGAQGRFCLRKRGLAAAAICALAAASGIYYAVFACFFLGVAGIAAALRARKARNLVDSLSLVLVIFATVILTMTPTLWFQFKHGRNPAAVVRNPAAGEAYALKVAQLLIPVDGHRIGWVAAKKAAYNRVMPLVNENRTATLGLVGSIGFVLLIGRILFIRRTESMVDHLAVLNLSAVLFAGIGGIGPLLTAAFVRPVRCYNRISVFIAFFCLVAVGLWFDELRKRGSGRKLAGALLTVGGGAALILGLLDQTSPAFVPPYSALKSAVAHDRAFFQRIESSLPDRAAVFQLPYIAFPEYRRLHKMIDYDHFRAYLNSHRLRWSYGAMKGRPGDLWQRTVVALPPAEMLRYLALSGFDGVYINRAAYRHGSTQIEREISRTLAVAPLVSDNRQMAFYSMVAYKRKLAAVGGGA